MTTLLRLWLLRWLAARSFGGVLLALTTAALPLAGALTIAGLPLGAVLGGVALPIAALLSAIGLRGLLVGVAVTGVVAVVGALLLVGLIALKIALLVMLGVWLVRWIRRRTRDDRSPAAPDTVGAAI